MIVKLILLSIVFGVYTYLEGYILKANYYSGNYNIVLIFNNETIHEDEVIFSKYDSTTQTLYFQTVKSYSTVSDILCRISSQKRIIWGPNGCSNIDNPALAIQSAFCIRDEVTVELLRSIFYQTWYLSKDSDECYLKGGQGDVRLCAGPLRLARDNKDSFLSYPAYSVRDLLASRMQFLDCLTGPLAMSPCVVRIQMSMPAIQITTNCVDPDTGYSYEDTYSNFESDPYRHMITDVWKAFKGNVLLYQRLLLKRESSTSVNFKITFGNVFAADGEYNFIYSSAVVNSSLETSEILFLNWIDSIDFGYNYTMYNSTGSAVCWAILTIPDEVTYDFIRPYLATAQNVSYNVNPRVYDKSSVCNIAWGRLSVADGGGLAPGQLMYPDCCEGCLCGGYVSYVVPGLVQMPIYVPPNPNLHYRLDCDEAYPKNNTFLDLNAVEIPRMNLASQICCAPFLAPDLILANTNPDERYEQCQSMFMYTYGKAQTYCCRPITTVVCQKGWIAYGERCFYKFNPSVDGKYASTLDQSDLTCSLLNSYAQPLVEVDFLTDLWIKRDYLYWKKNPNVFAAYRVPVFGASYCACYITGSFTIEQCPCYNIKYDDSLLIFPICFYYISVAALEPLYADVAVSLETAQLWMNGQEGPKAVGLEAVCNCYPNWTGKNCERKTCILADVIENSPPGDNIEIEFYRKCYANKQGSCYNGQALVCQCNPFYGPSASLNPAFPVLYLFHDVPCGCPAGTSSTGSFQINGQIYTNSSLYTPCSGINNGVCYVSNNTNIGYCGCNMRPNILLDVLEPAFDGKSCSSVVPIQPWNADVKNGIITTELCNHRGVSCPFGESYLNPFGDLYDPMCVDSDKEPIEGCSCFNGWGGSACTCPRPYDYALGFVFESFNNGYLYFKNMLQKFFIHYIKVVGCEQDSSTEVYLSNEVGKPDSSIQCIYNGTIDYYECGGTLAYQYIALSSITISDSCKVNAYFELFEYCGKNETINPFAGEFFNIPSYRGPKLYIENQYYGVANYGCTDTECFCNSNWGGPKCAAGVSSLRYRTVDDSSTTTREVLSKIFCGGSVSNPKIDDVVKGRGQINTQFNNCTCNAISNNDYSGSSGATAQYFNGSSCDCGMMYNSDRGEVLQCAGHGICKESEFPFGRCEVDVDKYKLDSLSSPFVNITSIPSVNVSAICSTDVYFLVVDAPTSTVSPTTQPVVDPTAYPTTDPTMAPTKYPTVEPTYAPDSELFITLYAYDVLTTGDIGTVGATDALCRSFFYANDIFCIDGFSFLEYSGRPIDGIPEELGFSYSIMVKAGQTNLNLGPWNQIVVAPSPSTSPVLAYTLCNAGVICDGFWTGYRAPNPDFNCVDWGDGTVDHAGTVGDSDTLGRNWIDGGGDTCDVEYSFLCGCHTNKPWISPTQAPTRFPTGHVPTYQPTMNPSRQPTKNPTKNPSKKPTTKTPTVSFPTKNPTIKPGTEYPTTQSPTTQTPTATPIINSFSNRGISYLYKLLSGSSVTLLSTIYDVSYNRTRASPTSIVFNSRDNALIPILWTDLIYRAWNYQTNITETLTLSECNPGNPSWIPGTPLLQPDGIYACPTTQKCILTLDCSDSLNPDINYANFPDLRACWCSHSESAYSGVNSLPPLTTYTLNLVEGSFSVTSSANVQTTYDGAVRCNSFVDRTINCMRALQDPNYLFQCADEPIGCYDGSIGRFFGAFNLQNPNYPYNIDWRKWTIGQFRGIASVMNYLVYMKNGQYVDPFTSELWNSYYWISSDSESYDVRSATATLVFDSYQTDLIQGTNYMYNPDGFPPALLNSSVPETFYGDMLNCAGGSPNFDNRFCTYITWQNKTYDGMLFRRTGFEYSITVPSSRYILGFNITILTNPGVKYYTGIEIFDQWNDKCGGVYNSTGFTIGNTYLVPCTNNPRFVDYRANAIYTVRLLGLNSIYDLPGIVLNSQMFVDVKDPLESILNIKNFQPFQHVTYPLMYALAYDDALLSNTKTWPQRQWINTTMLNTFPIQVKYNYTLIGSNGLSSGTVWNNITAAILENNTYPYNYPLSLKESLYDTREVDYDNPKDLEYLAGIWQVWLYERRCGVDEFQCKTFELGACIVETDYDQRWFNIGKDADYIFVGEEGGCDCNDEFSKGFYDFAQICALCQLGYGPFNLDELSFTIQYNTLVANIYPDGLFPSSGPSLTVDQFEANYSCRYPYGLDPIPASLVGINICAGHGMLGGFNESSIEEVEIWMESFIIACNSIQVKDVGDFAFDSSTTSLYSQMFVNGEDMITIIGTSFDYEVYYLVSGVLYQCYPSSFSNIKYPFPTQMSLLCVSSSLYKSLDILCTNDVLFSSDSLGSNLDLAYSKNPFLLKVL